VTHPLVSEADADGLVRLNALDQLHVRDNVGRFANEVSPFMAAPLAKPAGGAWLDTYYGQTFDALDHPAAAFYGQTEALPESPFDALANEGFLRVPFRRIPRRSVASRAEIETIIARVTTYFAGTGMMLLLRGQTTEYLLRRSSAAASMLYGSEAVFEPSLQPSAARAAIPLEAVMPQWCTILGLFASRCTAEATGWIPDADARAQFWQEWDKLRQSEWLHSFALALAQHYGLPSAGLDTTDRLDIALFFALRDHVRTGPHAFRAAPTASQSPVLYLTIQHEEGWMNYDTFAPAAFPMVRPIAQSAKFLHLGWGYHRNAPARQILAALYLDPTADYGSIPAAAEIYPSPSVDHFGRFLEEMISLELPDEIGSVLRRFHWVTD
jgi:hypothetical protein